MEKPKVTFEFSAGGLVFTKKGGLRFLLIQDSYGRWALPKGHIEKGERPEDAAVREIAEETGLAELAVRERVGANEYFFRQGALLIKKKVYYFLVETAAPEALSVNFELRGAAWFTAKALPATIGYDNLKPVIEAALAAVSKGAKSEK